jgi:hypothetical protein
MPQTKQKIKQSSNISTMEEKNKMLEVKSIKIWDQFK